jgi:hypothetical protein
LWTGAALGLLPLLADLAKSFYKRQQNVASGERHWTDSLDSPVALILAGLPLPLLGLGVGAGQLAITLPLLIIGHPLVGTIGKAAHLKREI